MCGIVILNYNTSSETIECIESVKRECEGGDYHIYVVDNASSDESVAFFEKKYRNDSAISVIASKSNLGYSGGNNIGIKAALNDGCSYIFLVNSDVIFENDVVSIVQECLKKNANVLTAGPAVHLKDGSYSQFARKPLDLHAYKLEKKPWSILLKNKARKARFYNYDINKDFVFSGMFSGCCIGFKKEYFDSFGFLDDNIFLFYEEDVIAHLLCKENKKAMICANAKVMHNEGTSMRNTDAGRLLTTRLYRWPTSIYVLNRYAGVCYRKCSEFNRNDHIRWKALALLNQAYKDNYEKYDKESSRLATLMNK